MISRFLLSLCCLYLYTYASDKSYLTQTFLNTTHDITALTYCNGYIYAGTTGGNIEIFNLETQSKAHTVTLDTIKHTQANNLVPAKIFHLDCYNNELLINTEGDYGDRILLSYTQKKGLKLILKNSNIYKAQWVDEQYILTSTLGNNVRLYDRKNDRFIYSLHASNANFSDFTLNKTHDLAAFTSESGDIDLLDVKNGIWIKKFNHIHKDKVYQLAFMKNIILSGGHDKKIGITTLNTHTEQFKKSDFFVYSVGLSPDETIGIYLASEDNTLNLFNIQTLEHLFTITADQSLTQYIIFIDKERFITSGDNDQILIWNLKGAL